MPKILNTEDHVGEKDLSGHRIWILDNGNKIHFVKHDPYGFWTLNYDKGTVPIRLTGQYTSFPEASRHALAYLTEIERTVVDKLDSSVQPNDPSQKSVQKWQEAKAQRLQTPSSRG